MGESLVTSWQYFPRSHPLPSHLSALLSALEDGLVTVAGSADAYSSDAVLDAVAPGLRAIGYMVESGKKKGEVLARPVLFGPNGTVEKSFLVDAFDSATGTILEVEAGRGVANNQFLKDFFEACAIQDAKYLAITVLNSYKPPSLKKGNPDFQTVCTFFDTLYASGRLALPLDGILIIGYDGYSED
jgi:hypothetical protein